jgi:PII-like signaling protein
MASDSNNESLSDTSNIFGAQNNYAQMFQMIVGFGISQIVHSAAIFSLAEHLAQGPKTAVEIAEAETLDVVT